MKLCYCDWMPLSVADWLSEALEAKGISQHTQNLLNLLHPRFCTSKSSPRLSDEFEETVHPDADFPPTASEFLKVAEVTNPHVSIELGLSPDLKWKNKAYVYLSSFYDKPEELQQLIENLFHRLHKSKLETENSKIHSAIDAWKADFFCHKKEPAELCESLKKAIRSTPEKLELNNNGSEWKDEGYDDTNQDNLLDTTLVPDSENMDRDDNIMIDNMTPKSHDSLQLKASACVEPKEGWECFPQIGDPSKTSSTNNLQGSRLREWSTTEWGIGQENLPSKMKQANIEPWETDQSLWSLGSAAEKKNLSSEVMPDPFSSMPLVERSGQNVFTTVVESNTNESSFYPWNINKNVSFNFGRKQRPMWTSNTSSLASTASQTASVKSDSYIEDQLFQSLQQLGINNLWENEVQPKVPSNLSFDQTSDMSSTGLGFNNAIGEPSRRPTELLPNVHYGPKGQHVDLNHVETSGFSPVVPHRDDLVSKAYANSTGISKTGGEPSGNDGEYEDENLLTSPRTHFRPIRQDSQCSPNEDEEDYADDGLVPLPEANPPNPEIVFQRSGSGNLMIENDPREGSPEKYMIYKETPEELHASSVSPEFNIQESNIVKEESPGLIPKFKVVNNEKFCQTEDQSFSSEAKSLSSLWSNTTPSDPKNIWSGSTNPAEKEAWEVDFKPLDSLQKQWSDASGNQVDDDLLSKMWNAQMNTDQMSLSFSEGTSSLLDSETYNGNLWEKSLRQNRYGDSNRASEVSKPWSPKEFIPQSAKKCEGKSSKWSFDWGLDEGAFVSQPQEKIEELKDDKDTTVLSPIAAQLEDLNNLGFELKGGFEWEHSNDQEIDEDSQDMIPVETEDGQMVYLPIEYLDNDLYDSLFDTDSEASVSGSFPSLPPEQLEQWKKKMSAKLAKRGRTAKTLPSSRRPCSFFLEGNCRRTDCKFSHDLSSITCRFWEEEGCLKGDMCPFYHGYAANTRRRNRSEGDQATEPINILDPNGRFGRRGRKYRSFELNSEADFPTLGSSFESRANSTEELSMVEIISKAPRTKKKKKSKGSRKEPPGPMSDPIPVPSQEPNANPDLPSKIKDSEKRPKRSSKRLASSLRKVLKTHQDILSKQSYSCHEDGTVSDF